MSSKNLHIEYQPKMRESKMIIGFDGWMDGGEVSTGTIDYLTRLLDARPMAQIDPGNFYVLNVPGSMEITALFRPHVKIEEGVVQYLDMPRNVFSCVEESNLVFLSGKEPNVGWSDFADCIFEIIDLCNVKEIFFVGSVGSMVPHTREPIFWSTASCDDLRDSLVAGGINATNYEGPGSFGTYMSLRASREDIRLATLVAGIPSYVEGRNVRCIEAVIDKLKAVAGIEVSTSELHAESAEFMSGLETIVSNNPKLAERIKKLEEFYDGEATEHTEDEVKDWFERQDLSKD